MTYAIYRDGALIATGYDATGATYLVRFELRCYPDSTFSIVPLAPTTQEEPK